MHLVRIEPRGVELVVGPRIAAALRIGTVLPHFHRGLAQIHPEVAVVAQNGGFVRQQVPGHVAVDEEGVVEPVDFLRIRVPQKESRYLVLARDTEMAHQFSQRFEPTGIDVDGAQPPMDGLVLVVQTIIVQFPELVGAAVAFLEPVAHCHTTFVPRLGVVPLAHVAVRVGQVERRPDVGGIAVQGRTQ